MSFYFPLSGQYSISDFLLHTKAIPCQNLVHPTEYGINDKSMCDTAGGTKFKFRLTKQFVDPPHNRILELSDDMKEFIGFIMIVERCYDVICI